MANANADEIVLSNGKSKSNDPDNERSKAAKRLLNKLKSENTFLNDLASKTEQLSNALVVLAYDAPKVNGVNNIGSSHSLLRLKNLENVLLPTHTLQLNKSANYSGKVYFR